MHDYDELHEVFIYQDPVHICWNCGMRGVLSNGGPLMICYLCDVMWACWQKPVSDVTYAPMYETI